MKGIPLAVLSFTLRICNMMTFIYPLLINNMVNVGVVVIV